MRTILTLLTFMLLMVTPVTIEASTSSGRSITLKKTKRYPKDTSVLVKRIPTAQIYCYVDSENGIEEFDTTDIETYEIWDVDDTAPIVVYEDEYSFADYILSNPSSCVIKLCSSDYIYVGIIE